MSPVNPFSFYSLLQLLPEASPISAEAVGGLARIHTARREWEEARAQIEREMEISKKIRNPSGKAMGIKNLGLLHYRKAEFGQAKEVRL